MGERHPSTVAILRYFEHDHLPPHLQAVARPVHDVAHRMADNLEGPELTAGLRHLLEAKDCFVRAALPDPPGRVESFTHSGPCDATEHPPGFEPSA